MDTARGRTKIATAVGLLTMLFGALLVLSPGAGAAPSPSSGNKSCQDILGPLGFTSIAEVKDDDQRDAPYPADAADHATITNGGFSVQYRLDSDGVRFRNASPNVYAVHVKQASASQDKSVEETFLPSGAASGFVAFTERQFSHITFCTGTPSTPPPPPTGSLSVDKALAGNAAAAHANDVFSFTLACTDNGNPVALAAGDAAFTLTEATPAKVVSGIPTGASCTVTETATNGATSVSITVDGDAATNTASRADIVIGNGTTRDVDVTNTFATTPTTPPPPPPGCVDDTSTPQDECNPTVPPPPGPAAGALTVTKAVTGGVPEDGWSFGFTVTSLGSFDLTDEDDTFGPEQVAPGTYTITEADSDLADLVDIDCGSATVVETDEGSVTVEVGEGESVSCTFTNLFPEVLPGVTPNRPGQPTAQPPAQPAPSVRGVQVTRQLPRTGSGSDSLVTTGTGLLLFGAVLTLGSRRRLRSAR